MNPTHKRKDERPDAEPLDDPRPEWQDEDREMEHRKPTLDETDEDPEGL